jgi:DNA mismatch repair protein MutS
MPQPSRSQSGQPSRRCAWSVLFCDLDAAADADRAQEPPFFADLNLDQIVGGVIARREPYDLQRFFYLPLRDPDAITFRQEVFAELERPEVHALMSAFAEQELTAHYERQRRAMRQPSQGFAHYHVLRGFLNAVLAYCTAVERLTDGLARLRVRSRGLAGLCEYLEDYRDGPRFAGLRDQARALDEELDQVRYTFLLKGSRITVGPFDEQPDYSAQIAGTFARFRQGAPSAEESEQRDWETYSAIGVLHLVAKVYPELFARLEEFCARHGDYLDATIRVLERELQFYLSYLDYIRPLRERGLCFSYPATSCREKAESALDTFDLALAVRLTREEESVVCNDLRLDAGERILVITGPNNGGKTTLARTVGQLHHLARLGCPVPGRRVRLFVCDQILTHFERREELENLTGRLHGELRRLHAALLAATPDSVFVLNEMFSSTTAQDALFLSREILGMVAELDALCVRDVPG